MGEAIYPKVRLFTMRVRLFHGQSHFLSSSSELKTEGDKQEMVGRIDGQKDMLTSWGASTDGLINCHTLHMSSNCHCGIDINLQLCSFFRMRTSQPCALLCSLRKWYQNTQ